MNTKFLFLFFLFFIAVNLCYGQGCVINAYNGFNRVFNKPTSAGARTFFPGNGNNFVRWEGTCGTHTYVETIGPSNGTCTVTENQVTRTGDYYPTVSGTFTRACNVPLDDNLWWVMLIIVPVTYFLIRKKNSLI